MVISPELERLYLDAIEARNDIAFANSFLPDDEENYAYYMQGTRERIEAYNTFLASPQS